MNIHPSWRNEDNCANAIDIRMLVSILNWNGVDKTLNLLRSLERDKTPGIRYIVIDNGSETDPCVALAEEFPDVEFLRLSENQGFTGGHNVALRLAASRSIGSVLLLNNDCILDADSVVELANFLEANPEVGAASALIYTNESPPRPLMVGGYIDWRRHQPIRPSVPGAPIPDGSPPLVVGTCLAVSTKAMQQVGLLSDTYFAYYDDNDLSVRLNQAGYSIAYCAHARCYHEFRKAHEYSSFALYLSTRNAWFFWSTHTPIAFRRRLRLHLLGDALLEISSLRASGASSDQIYAVVDGIWDAWHQRMGTPPAIRTSPWWLRAIMAWAPYRVGLWLGSR